MSEYRSETIRLFEKTGAKLEGHFQLASGLHGSMFVDAWRLYANPSDSYRVCQLLTHVIRQQQLGGRVEIVIGPERGAIWIAKDVARFYAPVASNITRAMIAEKDRACPNEHHTFVIHPRWQKELRGKRVVIVEDVMTSGGSVESVANLVRKYGGDPILAACIWNRGGVTAKQLNVPQLVALVDDLIPSYEPGNTCPGCNAGLELIKV